MNRARPCTTDQLGWEFSGIGALYPCSSVGWQLSEMGVELDGTSWVGWGPLSKHSIFKVRMVAKAKV